METDQRTKFHHAANNSRELRMLKSQEQIAENLGMIAQTLGLIYMKLYDDEYPQAPAVRNGVGQLVAMKADEPSS